jgi:hypothetical protein
MFLHLQALRCPIKLSSRWRLFLSICGMNLGISHCVNEVFTLLDFSSLDSLLVANVWRQPVRPIFLDSLTLEDGSDRFPRSVGKCIQIYSSDIQEERRSNLMRFWRRLKSFTFGVLGNERDKMYAWYYKFKSKFSIAI